MTSRMIWLGCGAFLAASGCLAAANESVAVRNDLLSVSFRLPEGTLTVTDRRTGDTWHQPVPTRTAQGRDWGTVRIRENPAGRRIHFGRAETDGRLIQAQGSWRGHPFHVTVALDPRAAKLTVSLDTPERDATLPWKPGWAGVMLMTYPYAFHQEKADQMVVPIDEGVRFSTRETDPEADPRRWRPWWLHRKLSMPWWGVGDGVSGVMTEIETPCDAMFSIQWSNTEAGERTLPQVTWVAEKEALGYPRTVVFRFLSEGGHVAMAKAFRHAEIARGRFRPWSAKIKQNPLVERLRGALDLWSSEPITAELIAAIRSEGIRHAVVSKSRGGNSRPGEGLEPGGIRAAEEAGFLIGGYHNMTWIQSRWIDREPSLRDAAMLPADGKLAYIKNAWDAKGRLDRCPAMHQGAFLKRAKGDQDLGMTYFFTDCTTTGGSVGECYHPDHPVTRRSSLEALDQALHSTALLGMVVGSERGKWWATRSTHVFEGIETLVEYAGKYYGSGDFTHWVGPYLTQKAGFRELFIGYDFNPARRLPLFQLVYHDSVYCTRRWNQDPGRDSSLWTRHDLLNILNGTAPLVFMRPRAGNVIGSKGWATVRDRYLQTYRDVCGWHEAVGFDEMTDHRILSPDRLVQETHFSSGRFVVVNFGQTPWQDPRGFRVPPEAYHTGTRQPAPVLVGQRTARRRRPASGTATDLPAEYGTAIRGAREKALKGNYEDAAAAVDDIQSRNGREVLHRIARGFRAAGEMRKWIVQGISNKPGEKVLLKVMGRRSRVTILAADAHGLKVKALGRTTPMPWEQLAPDELLRVSRKYVSDPAGRIPPEQQALLDDFALACGLRE